MATMEAPPRLQIRLHQGAFKNEPFVDFSKEDNVRKMRAAIEKVRGQLGREYDLIIGGKRIQDLRQDPFHQSRQAVGGRRRSPESGQGARRARHAGRAEAFDHWSRTSVEERAVALISRRRHDARAQDGIHGLDGVRSRQELGRGRRRHRRGHRFLRVLRARGAALGQAEPPVQLPGERDTLALHPARRRRGDSAVEFPLRHHGRHDGRRDRHRQHGRPEAVERFADDRGEVRGTARRSRHARRRRELLPRLRRELRRRAGGASEDALHRFHRLARGRTAHQRARRAAAPGQIWIKRTILEMGGKDAIIVDADADIDAAVEGVAAAAFGFQGQKCSACSRAIVDERIYDKFLEKLKARAETHYGRRSDARTRTWAAVINEGSMNDILDYIEVGKKDGRLITGGARDTSASAEDG